LIVNGHREERAIKEGDAYNIKFEPDAAPAPEPAGAPRQHAYNSGAGHLIFSLVFVRAAAAMGTIIYHSEAESDSAPQ